MLIEVFLRSKSRWGAIDRFIESKIALEVSDFVQTSRKRKKRFWYPETRSNQLFVVQKVLHEEKARWCASEKWKGGERLHLHLWREYKFRNWAKQKLRNYFRREKKLIKSPATGEGCRKTIRTIFGLKAERKRLDGERRLVKQAFFCLIRF